ncbi:olfactory receptor 11L1-like [Leptodactylus fuscus]
MNISEATNVTLVTEFYLVGFQISQCSLIFLFCLILVVYCGTICGNLLIITLVSTSKILHTPMYFFISQLSITDILLTTDIVPNMLYILLNHGGAITFARCITQLYFFCASETFECFLLTVMSYDRYVAICNPLHYNVIMRSGHCKKLAILSWFFGYFCALIDTLVILMLTFCGPNVIEHFFCDLAPLTALACSGGQTLNIKKLLSLLYTVFTPFINPIIYSLRNKDISKSLQKIIKKCRN